MKQVIPFILYSDVYFTPVFSFFFVKKPRPSAARSVFFALNKKKTVSETNTSLYTTNGISPYGITKWTYLSPGKDCVYRINFCASLHEPLVLHVDYLAMNALDSVV